MRLRIHWWSLGTAFWLVLVLNQPSHALLSSSRTAFIGTRPCNHQPWLSMSLHEEDNIIIGGNATLSLPPRPVSNRQRRPRADEMASSSLGDIMSSGLTTSAAPGSLATEYGIDNPLDRMLLTANGNLQRLVASYYDADVQVVVDHCQPCPDTPSVWDRTVHLTVFDQTFCTASSSITIHDRLCQDLVESGQVGLGQLFRFLDLLPEFTLLEAGVEDDYHTSGRFWRDYRLECAELSCRIREDFDNVWHRTAFL